MNERFSREAPERLATTEELRFTIEALGISFVKSDASSAGESADPTPVSR